MTVAGSCCRYLTYTFNDDFTWQSDFIIERTGNKVGYLAVVAG